MAEVTKDDKAAAEIEAAKVAAEAELQSLVAMVKEGVVSFVHETCVAAHAAVGWVLERV